MTATQTSRGLMGGNDGLANHIGIRSGRAGLVVAGGAMMKDNS